MGAIHVDVTIRNPTDPSRSWRGPFLVDTGATDSIVPRQHLEAIGLSPRGRRTYRLADGRSIQMDVALAEIECLDEFVGGTVVFGDTDGEPLLGVTALESMGVEVDPRTRELHKRPAVRLMAANASPAGAEVAPVEYSMPISAFIVDKLGVKLYDRASAVVAELLSNSYDADATEVTVRAPLGKYLATEVDGELQDRDYTVEVSDNGTGMTPTEMNTFFLPVGTERREDPARGATSKKFGRKVMGRKGVGKLAPFGICKIIEVRSAGGEIRERRTPDGSIHSGYLTSHVILNYDDIAELGKTPDRKYYPTRGNHDGKISPSRGTTIVLRNFYRKRVPDADTLPRQIAQRFGIRSDNWTVTVADSGDTQLSRTVGRFAVQTMPNTRIDFFKDKTVTGPEGTQIDKLCAGFLDEADRFYPVTGWMAYSKKPYRDELMAGVRIYCRGKIASQTSLFNRRAGFTGEHSIRSYLVGELHADWLDEEDDLIQTDRRDILWSDPRGMAFQKWGQDLVKYIGKLSRNPLQEAARDTFWKTGDVSERIGRAFPGDQQGDIRRHALELAEMFGKHIARAEARDQQVVNDLVELCVLLAPHVTFKEMMREAVKASHTPFVLLARCLRTARIAELTALGRVAEDRVRIVQQLQERIADSDTQEAELQSLLAQAPWLINPEWTLLTANQRFRTLVTQFEKYYAQVTGTSISLGEATDPTKRPDFVLFAQDGKLQIVEIKAPKHRLVNEEMDRLVSYCDCMRDFLNDPGHRHFRELFWDFRVTLVCDELALKGAQRAALEGYLRQGVIEQVRWGVFLSKTKLVHDEFLREAQYLQKAQGKQRG